MVDVVFSEIELPSTADDWKTAMRRRAISTREVLNRHRWAVGLMKSHATPGPASLRVHDAVLGRLREGAEEQVRQFVELAEQRQFATLAQEFPYLSEVVAEVGYDFAAAFEYGLDLILDALEHGRGTS